MKRLKKFLSLLQVAGIISVLFLVGSAPVESAIPKIISYQGRLTNTDGDLQGGSGTNYYFRFAIFAASSGGAALWPSGTPATITASVANGVFNINIGDSSNTCDPSCDLLTQDFNDSDSYYLEVRVASASNFSDGETLTPRQRIVASGYAVNADTVDGAHASTSTGANTIPITDGSGIINLTSATAGITATSTNAFTLQSAATGDIRFFSSANALTSAGNLTLAGLFTANGVGTSTITGSLVTALNLQAATTTLSGTLTLANFSSDPGGSNGRMYYDTGTGKFRCYQNGSWTNCIGGSVGGSSSGGGWDTNLIGYITLTTSTDRVGIGISAPTSKLHVVSTTAATTTIIAQGALSQTANLFEARNNTSEVLAWVNPSGGLGASSTVYITSVGTTPGIQFSASGTFRATPTDALAQSAYFFDTTATLSSARLLRISNNASERFAIDSSGNVAASGTLLVTGSGTSTISNGLTAGGLNSVYLTVTGSTGTSTLLQRVSATNLATSGGLTVSGGGIILPAAAIQDAALSTNVALLNANQTFTGTNSFSLAPRSSVANGVDLGIYSTPWRDIIASGTLRIGNTSLASSTITIVTSSSQNAISFAATGSLSATPTDVASNAAYTLNTTNTLASADLLRLLSNGTTQFAVGPTGLVSASGTILVTGSGTSTITNGLTANGANSAYLTVTGSVGTSTILQRLQSTGINSSGGLSVSGAGSSTLLGITQASVLNITSNTATSTFANGIQLNSGCFLMPDGTCAGAGSGSGANTALSNLSAVSINAALTPDGNNTRAIGAFGTAWSNIFASGTIRGSDLVLSGVGTSTSNGSLSLTVLNITSNTATSTFANGIQLAGGCFRDGSGTCVGGGASANTSLSNLASVAINTSLLSDANNTDDLGSYVFSWKNIYASGTIFASTFGDVGTSTFNGGLSVPVLNITSNTATSTFANGIQLNGGCFRLADGTCAGAGSGANTALSNLAAVAINTSLLSDANNTDDLGAYGFAWRNLYASSSVRVGSSASTTWLSGDALIFGATTSSGYGAGVFNVSTMGNLSASGTVNVFGSGTSTIPNGFTATGANSAYLTVTGSTGTSTLLQRVSVTNLATSGGLTVSGGGIILPSASIQDAALSTNVALLNANQTFTGTNSFSLAPRSSVANGVDLGIYSTPWRDVIASGTLAIGNTSLASSTITILTSQNQNAISFAGTGSLRATPTDVASNAAYSLNTSAAISNADLFRLLANGTTQFAVGPTGLVSASGTILITGAGTSTISNGLTANGANSVYLTVTGSTGTSTLLQRVSATNLATSGGLTVSGGGIILPAASIQDAALSTNVALLNANQTFTGTNSFSLAPRSSVANGVDLGIYSTPWRDIIASGTLRIGNTSLASSTITILTSQNQNAISFAATGSHRATPTDVASNAAYTFDTTAAISNADLFRLLANGTTQFAVGPTGLVSASGTLLVTGAGTSTISNGLTANGANSAYLTVTGSTGTSTLLQRVSATNLATSGGLTVSGGGIILPSASIQDAALSTNVALLNANQTFTGTNSFSLAPRSSVANGIDLGIYGTPWRDIIASGTLRIGNTSLASSTITIVTSSGQSAISFAATGSLSATPTDVASNAAYSLNTTNTLASADLLRLLSNGTVQFSIGPTGNISSSGTLRLTSPVTNPALSFSATGSLRSTPTDVASNAAYTFDTTNTLASADLLRLLSNGTVQFSVGPTGNISSSGTLRLTSATSTNSTISFSATGSHRATPTDVASNAAYTFDTTAAISNADLLRLLANGTPQFTVGPTGSVGASGTLRVAGAGTSTFVNGVNVLAVNATGSVTSTFANGIQLNGGCYRDASGNCLGASSGANQTLSNLTDGAVAINTSLLSDTNNTDDLGSFVLSWKNIYASGTIFASTFGATTGTSTFNNGLSVPVLNVTSNTATSTFANGIQLNTGCFRGAAGNCLTSVGEGWTDSGNLMSLTTNTDVLTIGQSAILAGGPQVGIVATSTTAIPLIIQGAASQSAVLSRWQNSAGLPLAWINSSGGIGASGTSYFNGRVSIGASGTPWGFLTVATGTTNNGIDQPLFVVATSTVNGQTFGVPAFVVSSTSTGDLDHARVSVGTSSINQRDQFFVQGRINSSWRYLNCDAPGSAQLGALTVSTANACGGNYMLFVDGAGSFGFSSSTDFGILRTGTTIGQGVSLRTGVTVASSTLNPVIEARVGIPTPATIGNARFIVGFTNYGPNNVFKNDTASDPSNGAYFRASSTILASEATRNWVAVLKNNNIETALDTGINASSTAIRTLRVELGTSTAYYLIDGQVVAQFGSNASTSPRTNLSPNIQVATTRGGAVAKDFYVYHLRTWIDDPPGGSFISGGGGSLDAPDPGFSSDYVSGASQGIWYRNKDPDEQPPPGTVMALAGDLTDSFLIASSTRAYQSNVIGVVAESPQTILGQNTGSVPVGISGRLEVRVNARNGPIKAGDLLTSSSEPGVAMRATKAGAVFARALTGFDGEGEGKVVAVIQNTYSLGTGILDGLDGVTVASSTPLLDRLVLARLTAGAVDLEKNESLSELFTDRIAAGLEVITPRVVTDALVVNTIEPVDGDVTLKLLQSGQFIVKSIASSTSAGGLESASSTPADERVVIRFDGLGNAFFAGEVWADTVTANRITGLEVITDRISSLSDTIHELSSADENTSLVNLDVVGELEAQGALVVAGASEFQGPLTVASGAPVNLSGSLTVTGTSTFVGEVAIATLVVGDIVSPALRVLGEALGSATSTLAGLEQQFVSATLETASGTLAIAALEGRVATLESNPTLELADLLGESGALEVSGVTMLNGGLKVDSIGAIGSELALLSDTVFFGRPYFTTDTAGFALVKQGQTRVDVTFEREYIEQPIVAATMTLDIDPRLATASSTERELIELEELALREAIFGNDVRYLVTGKSVAGFTVTLNKPAPVDMQFSWIALAVKGAKTFTMIEEPLNSNTDGGGGVATENIDGGGGTGVDGGLITPIIDDTAASSTEPAPEVLIVPEDTAGAASSTESTVSAESATSTTP